MRPKQQQPGPVLGQAPATPSLEELGFGNEAGEDPIVETDVDESAKNETASKNPPPPPEKFYRVQISPRTHEDEEERVPVGVNNDVLYIRRGETVVLPRRFLEVFDNSLVPIYSGKSNSDGRQQVGMHRRVNYTMLGEATEAEYIELRKRGILAMKQYEKMLPKENR
jgi:hypothetical protein